MAILSLPPTNASADVQLDWLELRAFFDEFKRARLDELSASRRTLEEEQAEDIAEFDQDDDLFRAEIEQELNERKNSLGSAYPFDLSGDAEELKLTSDLSSVEAGFYLVCLIASHTSGSTILARPPEGNLENRLRKRVFQVLGTLAVAGKMKGPAVTLGWPREDKETILEVLRRAEGWGFGLAPRDKPGRFANPMAKDGGIDVIGWTLEDRPPPIAIAFGQLASGHNWKGKPASVYLKGFIADFFEDADTGQHICLTVIPHRISDDLVYRDESRKHGYLCDRCKAPRHALDAIEHAAKGVPMDEVGNIAQVSQWISDYRAFALVA